MPVSHASFVIRPIKAQDRAQWGALWRQYLAFYDTSLPDAQYDLSFARMIGDDPQDFSGIVAERDGQLVGLCHYVFHRHGWKSENVCYLQDLFTAPDQRGGGIARALIHEVYRIADAAGAPAVYWMTQDNNQTARALYDQVAHLTPFVKYARF